MSAPLASPAGRRLRRTVESARVTDRLALVPHRSVPAPRTPFVALMVLLLAGGVFGLLMFNTQMQQRSFAITKLQARASALTATVQALRIQQQQSEDPQHLALAAKKLGMVVPANPTFITLGSGRVRGIPLMSSMGDGMDIRQPAVPKPGYLNKPPRKVWVPATNTTANTAAKNSATTGGGSTNGKPAQGSNSKSTNHR